MRHALTLLCLLTGCSVVTDFDRDAPDPPDADLSSCLNAAGHLVECLAEACPATAPHELALKPALTDMCNNSEVFKLISSQPCDSKTVVDLIDSVVNAPDDGIQLEGHCDEPVIPIEQCTAVCNQLLISGVINSLETPMCRYGCSFAPDYQVSFYECISEIQAGAPNPLDSCVAKSTEPYCMELSKLITECAVISENGECSEAHNSLDEAIADRVKHACIDEVTAGRLQLDTIAALIKEGDCNALSEYTNQIYTELSGVCNGRVIPSVDTYNDVCDLIWGCNLNVNEKFLTSELSCVYWLAAGIMDPARYNCLRGINAIPGGNHCTAARACR